MSSTNQSEEEVGQSGKANEIKVKIDSVAKSCKVLLRAAQGRPRSMVHHNATSILKVGLLVHTFCLPLGNNVTIARLWVDSKGKAIRYFMFLMVMVAGSVAQARRECYDTRV